MNRTEITDAICQILGYLLAVVCVLLVVSGCARGKATMRESTHVQGQVAGQPVDVVIQRQQHTTSETTVDLGPIARAIVPAATGALGMSPLSLAGVAGIAGLAGLYGRKKDRDQK